ncbi:MAG TPA: glycosyltransferase, partial [Acidimicrobiales bacterium]|nr:glycosyltransferase [Acidimicrobiales bacterium]
MESSRVLVLCFDPLTDAMPGPAIRAWHLALQLSKDHEVVLAGTAGATRTSPSMDVRAVTGGADLDELVGWCDAVFAPTSVVRRHPVVVGSGKPLCIDMYIPTHLENLEPFGAAGGAEHVAAVQHQVSVLNDDLRHGDFFLCASERQRDFWLGSLASLGRVNPEVYGGDPTLRALIDVVPFGVDPGPPPAPAGVLRRAFPAIAEDDPVVIWGGGVYNWFDPLSLVRAVDSLRRSGRPRLRLVFMGMRHPNPGIPEMRMAESLRSLSAGLGLTGTHVFFNEGWVPYEERGSYLADADVAVSTHLAHIETHFSFRTRVLDYLWAGLPMVLTGGDTLSDGIAAAGLGVAVEPGDPPAIADAIDRLLTRPPQRAEVRAYGARFAWDAVAGPLCRYMAEPRPARDRGSRPVAEPPVEAAVAALVPTGLRHVVGERLPEPVRRRVAALLGAARR